VIFGVSIAMNHDTFMMEAVRLSANGFPAPNPHVGCVIVRDHEIIGRGFHEYAGGPHAEIVALQEAGELAKGATAYVTLEPCNHQGRTGPCSEALIQAGVAKVVVAVLDPNPQAQGGVEVLRMAGIEVVVGICKQEAAKVNIQFLFAMAKKRPLVTVKIATTLDGMVCAASGKSKWITSDDARIDAQKLRAVCGSVLVGRKTAETDQSRLTVRDWPVKNQPARIVLDPHGRLSCELPIFNDEAETIHVTGKIDLNLLLAELFQRGINGVLVEGGATTVSEFLRAGLVDRIYQYVAPKAFGQGTSWAHAIDPREPNQESEFDIVDTRKLTNDLRIFLEHRNLANFQASY
jgi:diaminohydroxyphosphoribosylaminopyrimidine deaminase / 5-amino-6-(5-phosphoribosylamino)uracil reductase